MNAEAAQNKVEGRKKSLYWVPLRDNLSFLS